MCFSFRSTVEIEVETRRMKIAVELLVTERTYVESLNMMIKVLECLFLRRFSCVLISLQEIYASHGGSVTV